jgi:hypothetical protein
MISSTLNIDQLVALPVEQLTTALIAAKKAGLDAQHAKDAADPAHRYISRRRADETYRYFQSVQLAAALKFGIERGWTLTKSEFSLKMLARGSTETGGSWCDAQWDRGGWRGDLHAVFDHAYYYRRDRRAAAIVAHLYNWPDVRAQCEAVAAHYGLTFEAPDYPSWWNLHGTKLVVYRHRPQVVIVDRDLVCPHCGATELTPDSASMPVSEWRFQIRAFKVKMLDGLWWSHLHCLRQLVQIAVLA